MAAAYIVVFDAGGFLNGRGRKSAEFPDAHQFPSKRKAFDAADKAKVCAEVTILTVEAYDAGKLEIAAFLKSLAPRSQVRVHFDHRAGVQVIDLLSAGCGGGTCFMEESSLWPRSYEYAEIISAEAVAS